MFINQETLFSNRIIANCCFCISAVLFSFSVYTFYAENADKQNSANIQIEATKSIEKNNIVSINKISNYHVFGQYSLDTMDNSSPTQLQLQLQGILSANKKANSSAIISMQNEESRIYYIGDSIHGLDNTIIKDIQEDKVILSTNGKIEYLELPKLQLF